MTASERMQSPGRSITIDRDSSKYTISAKHLVLDREDEPLRLAIDIEKVPTVLQVGSKVSWPPTVIDSSDKIAALAKQAEDLRTLPEIERIRPLTDIVYRTLTYPTPEVLASLSPEERLRALSVIEYIIDGTEVPLSRVVDTGYGICRHYVALQAYLGQHAGLRSNVVSIPANTILNIMRSDTGLPLLQSVPVGARMSVAHAVMEFYLDSGAIIPVDPTKYLIADNPMEREIFQGAEYIGELKVGLPFKNTSLSAVRLIQPVTVPFGVRSFSTEIGINGSLVHIIETGKPSKKKFTPFEGSLNMELPVLFSQNGFSGKVTRVSQIKE